MEIFNLRQFPPQITQFNNCMAELNSLIRKHRQQKEILSLLTGSSYDNTSRKSTTLQDSNYYLHSTGVSFVSKLLQLIILMILYIHFLSGLCCALFLSCLNSINTSFLFLFQKTDEKIKQEGFLADDCLVFLYASHKLSHLLGTITLPFILPDSLQSTKKGKRTSHFLKLNFCRILKDLI